MKRMRHLLVAFCGLGLAAETLLAATATSDEFALSIKHDGIRASGGSETLRYSTLWDGDAGGTVTISQNGTALVSGLTDEGAQAWSVSRNGTYELTHTTYTNGLVAGVQHAAFVVTDKPWLVTNLVVVASTNSVEGGATVTYQAIAILENGSKSNVTDFVTWSVDPSDYGTIENGLLTTAESTDASRSATVTATYDDPCLDEPLTDSKDVTITFSSRLKRPMSLTINGDDTIDAGATKTYTATVTYNDGSSVEKTLEAVWSVTPTGGVATVVKGDENVKLTAAWTATGTLELKAAYSELCATGGSSLTGTVYYVNGTTGNDSNSGLSPTAAKKTIQAAIDVAPTGSVIRVAAGTYDIFASLNKTLLIEGVVGADATIIDGGCDWTKELSLSADDCYACHTNTIICGFTIQRTTRIVGGTVERCVVKDNDCSSVGFGAVNFAIVKNCLIVNNRGMNGAASDGSVLRNCTIVGNSASSGYDGVCLNSVLENCVVYGNANNDRETWPYYFVRNPLVAEADHREVNVYVGDPRFADAANGDYRLAADSPCIDAGTNAYVFTSADLDGNARIANGTVDLGCYEYGSSPVATDAGSGSVTVVGTKTVTVIALDPPSAPTVSASDGSATNSIALGWTEPTSKRPIIAYEVSRQKKGEAGWTVLTNTLTTTSYVDTTAEPGEDYTYRVRGSNEAGWGEYGSDDGWRAISLELDPTSWTAGYGATNCAVEVSANTGWAITAATGDATTSTSADGFTATLAANTTLSDRSGSVTVTAGGSTDHPVSATFSYTQSKRPPILLEIKLVDGADSLEGGSSTNFHVLAIFDDGTTNDVTAVATWSIDHPEYGTITAGTLSTYETTDLHRSAKVSVTYDYATYQPTKLTASQDVAIGFTKRLKRPVSIEIAGTNTVEIGETASYTATVTYNDESETEVTLATNAVWSVEPGSPFADLKKGAAAYVLTPYFAGTNFVLAVSYTETCGKQPSGDEPVTVEDTLTVAVPPAITIPVAVDREDWVFTTGSSVGGNVWYGQKKATHDGTDAAQSGRLVGEGANWMETTVTEAGDVSFWWKTSSEASYDSLTFAVDGVVQAQTSGTTNGWRRLSFEIPAGTHTLRWTYAKDGKCDAGSDCGWVDEIAWDPLSAPSATTGTVAVASVAASDGEADFVEVTWEPFASRRLIFEYELARRTVGKSDWEILATSNILRYVDFTAEPGADYEYRVRARNAAGWGVGTSDTGWRAFSLAVDPTLIAVPYTAFSTSVVVAANGAWTVASDAAWLTVGKSSDSEASVVASEHALDLPRSLQDRTNTVTVTVGAGMPHPTNAAVSVVQQGRPPRHDVGFFKINAEWRTRLQIATNDTVENVYSPVSAFTAAEPLAISFGWTNRSDVAVSPSVRFRLYTPESPVEPVAEWTVDSIGSLEPGKGAWSGHWPFEALKILKPGDYRLEAEIGPEFEDTDTAGDVNRDQADNVAIFRFAVRHAGLSLGDDVFGGSRWNDLAAQWGNDFAQPPHAANAFVENATNGHFATAVQFGPYVPMNGVKLSGSTVQKPLDLVLLVDDTLSMRPGIAGLVKNVSVMVDQLLKGDDTHDPVQNLRIKVVGFHDYKDYDFYGGTTRPWFKEYPFSTDPSTLKNELTVLRDGIDGGSANDGESSFDALYYLCKGWTQNTFVGKPTGYQATPYGFGTNSTRVVVLFTDEPPHVLPYKDKNNRECNAPGCIAPGEAGMTMAMMDAALREANVHLMIVGDGLYQGDMGTYVNGYKYGELVELDPANRSLEEPEEGHRYTGALAEMTGDADFIRSLAGKISAQVETEVVKIEPTLSVSVKGSGYLTFSWCNNATNLAENSFSFTADDGATTNLTIRPGEGWRTETVRLDAGSHALRWAYGKENYMGAVSDCGLVGDIVWDPDHVILELDPESFTVDHPGSREEGDEHETISVGEGNLVVSVTNNTTWAVLTNGVPDWITFVSREGVGNGEIVFQVATNATYESRSATVTVRAEAYVDGEDPIERTFSVRQEASPFVPDDRVHLLKVEVKPRWPWKQRVDVDFRIVLPNAADGSPDGKSATITMTGLNGEGGDMVDDFPVLKQLKECPAKNNVYFGFGNRDKQYEQDKVTATDSSGLRKITCTTSGWYRISWDMAKDWYDAGDAARKLKTLGIGQKDLESAVNPWTDKNGFHSPAFSVRLNATCDGNITTNAPSNVVRVDTRIVDMTVSNGGDPYVSESMAGGKILTGIERIGHPYGAVDPVEYDTRDANLFPSNGWNSLDFVEDLDAAWSNRFDAAYVINDERVAIEGGVITATNVWTADRVHVVRDNVFVARNAKLIIEENAVVKFCDCTRIYVYEDTSATVRTEARHNIVVKGAYLTYGYDDTYDGDTLCHKNKAPGNWGTGKRIIYSQGLSDGAAKDTWKAYGTDEVDAYTSLTEWQEECAIIRIELKDASRDPSNNAATTPTHFKYRYYSYGQNWGTLPRPSRDGCAFYGWYTYDPKGVTPSNYKSMTTLNTDEYPYAKQAKTSQLPRTIYALLCSTDWADSIWPQVDASGGHVKLNVESVVYDGLEHRPNVDSLTVNDSLIATSKYAVDYGSGDYTAAGQYAVGVTFGDDSDYTGTPTGTFTIERRPVAGGEILFSDPTNGVMYKTSDLALEPELKLPTVTVRLPDYRGSSISDAVVTADADISWIDLENDLRVWPEVGDYTVVASYAGNPNYTGGAVTNVFTISVNPDYVFQEFESLDDVTKRLAYLKEEYHVTPRVIRFSGRTNDVVALAWKEAIRGNTALNDFVSTNFACWVENTKDTPAIGVRSEQDLTRDIAVTGGVLSVSQIFDFLTDALTAPELPEDASAATLTLAEAGPFAYDGTEHNPAVTVKLGDDTIASSEYDLVYSGGVDVGTYSVYAVFRNKAYCGTTASVSYSVTPRTITLGDVTVDPSAAAYDGRMHKPAVSTGDIPSKVDYGTGDFTEIGTYPIVVTASGNYTGSVTTNVVVGVYTVEDAVIALRETSAEVKKSKSGDAVDVKPHVESVSDALRTYEPDVDYDIAYSEPTFTTAGVYTVSAVFKGRYAGTASVSFTVTEATDAVVGVEGDPGATVEPDPDDPTLTVVRPSADVRNVVVDIPDGIDAGKVVVELSTSVESVKPNGATIRIVSGGYDITALLVLPDPDADGVVDLTKATVADEVVGEILDPDETDTIIDLDPSDPVLQIKTRAGLTYQLLEGTAVDGRKAGDSTLGDGKPWRPAITVKGGASGFYSIDVHK